MPSDIGGIYFPVVADFSRLAKRNFKCIQVKSMAASVQSAQNKSMLTPLLDANGAHDSLSGLRASSLNDSEWVFSGSRRFFASISKAKYLFANLGYLNWTGSDSSTDSKSIVS